MAHTYSRAVRENENTQGLLLLLLSLLKRVGSAKLRVEENESGRTAYHYT